MSHRGVKGRTKSCETHVHDQPFGRNETIDIWQSQWVRKEGNASINKVSTMTPGLAKIFEKVCSSRNFESPETDFLTAVNACCIDFTDTGSLKHVHWLSQCQSTNCSTTYYGWGNIVEVNTVVAGVSRLITGIDLRLAHEYRIQWLPATIHNAGRMDHRQVRNASFKAIPLLGSVDVEMAYSYSESCWHFPQWHVRSYGRWYVSVSQEEDSMEGRLILGHEVGMTEVVQILY